ncbi:MAG TPA: cyclase family protein [Pyrinomonadaceae bacterium]|nr:cyclase family protein [Pyrinomonadaceae bacterium]
MTISIEINGQTETVDIDNPIDISIPLQFNGPQPNAYDVERAVTKAYETGDLVGDTRRGGSCNFEQITLVAHCNGTHTECVGHITHERISVNDCLKDAFIPAMLVSVEPQRALETDERYSCELTESDLLITRSAMQTIIENRDFLSAPPAVAGGLTGEHKFAKALIIRTLPNDTGKLIREYTDNVPPFFTTEAMNYIVSLGIRHLLIDTPSIDRLYDEGKLSNHRAFWGIEAGNFETDPATRLNNTVTELIYVPDDISDGEYLLNLQIAPFSADAAPSRPILFALN